MRTKTDDKSSCNPSCQNARTVIEICVYAALAYAFVYALTLRFSNAENEFVLSTVNLAAGVTAFLALYFGRQADKRTRWLCLAFAFLFSILYIVGYVLYRTDRINVLLSVPTLLRALVCLAGLTAVIGSALAFLWQRFLSGAVEKDPLTQHSVFDRKYVWLVVWALILLCWVPCFLAYYPGMLNPDAGGQIGQSPSAGTFTMHHPPLHTFILKVCLKVGRKISFEPIILYTALQTLLLSGAFAWLARSIWKHTKRAWLVVVTVLFLSVNPVVAVSSLTATKENFLVMALIMFLTQTWNLLDNEKDFFSSLPKGLAFMAGLVLCCLFRNNAVYAFALSAPVFCIVYRKRLFRMLVLLAIPFALYFAMQNIVYPGMGATPTSPVVKLFVPTQQLALASIDHSEELPSDLKEELEFYLPYDNIADVYNPRYGESFTAAFPEEYYMQHTAEFWSLWMRMLKLYPDSFVNAFLTLNLPYWYPDANTLDEFSQRLYLETGISNQERTYETDYTFERDSKLPELLPFYESVADYSLLGRIPIVSYLCSLSAPIWLLLLCALALLLRRRAGYLLMLLPVALYWLTFLLGPVSNFRYVFPLYALYPLFLALTIQPPAPQLLER